jgi:hypothetical protein
MFLHFGNTYINTSQIKRITPIDKGDRSHWAEIEMIDGVRLEGYLHLEKIEMLSMHIVPAPPGYETIDIVHGSASNELLREVIVAFALEPGFDRLIPITVQSGVLEESAIKCPDGKVYGTQQNYSSEADFLADHSGKAEAA